METKNAFCHFVLLRIRFYLQVIAHMNAPDHQDLAIQLNFARRF